MKKIIKTAFLCILFLWADTVFAQTFTNPKIEKLATISRTSGAGRNKTGPYTATASTGSTTNSDSLTL